MRIRILTWFALAGASTGFGAPVDCKTIALKSATQYDCKLGNDRRYLLYLPSAFKSGTALPVILSLHGGGASPENFNEMTGMQGIAEKRGLILITPAGTANVWNAGSCCDSAAMQFQNIDDIGFLTAVLDQVQAMVLTDTRRVYVLGFSNGAMMAHRVGCEMSHRIAGIAPISGGLQNREDEVGPELFQCQPKKAFSVVEINGKPDKGALLWGADSCAPFDGGETTLPSSVTRYRRPIQESFDVWKTAQGCEGGGKKKLLGTGVGRYECVEFEGCQSGASTMLCTIPNGAHWFPGALTKQPTSVASVCGRGVPSSISAANVSLDFLLSH